jgi:hypothetical protein
MCDQTRIYCYDACNVRGCPLYRSSSDLNDLSQTYANINVPDLLRKAHPRMQSDCRRHVPDLAILTYVEYYLSRLSHYAFGENTRARVYVLTMEFKLVHP